MTLGDLQTLVDYHYWARDRLLDAVEPLTDDQWRCDLHNSFRTIHETVVHIYGAEWAWQERWHGRSPTALFDAERLPKPTSVRPAWIELEGQVRGVLTSLGEGGVGRVYEYKMINGTAASSPFWQMLQHVVNHASYHRGQVTTMLRQLGLPPAKSMDLIAYYRSR